MSAIITRKMQTVPKCALSIDWETSGYSAPDYASKHQGISFGAVVFDARTFDVIDTLYCEIKFDGQTYKWDDGAQKVHGLSREHLEQHGVTQEEAAVQLAELCLKYFGPEEEILIAAHNPNFDKAFTRQLFDKFGLNIKLWFRAIDTCCLASVLLGVVKSDDLYAMLGLPARTAHNALEDALYTVESCRLLKQTYMRGLGTGTSSTGPK